MAKAKVPVALCAPTDFARAIQLLRKYQDLADSIRTFDVVGRNNGVYACRVGSLFEFLSLCENLERLFLGVDASSDLKWLCTQLSTRQPQGLPNLRQLTLSDQSSYVGQEGLLEILNVVPNLRRCALFSCSPRWFHNAANVGAALVDSMHFEYLEVHQEFTGVILPLLLSCRWTARVLDLPLGYESNMQLLSDTVWASCPALPITRLSIRLEISRVSTTPLAFFVLNACRALRSLEIEFLYREDMGALLHHILTDVRFRVKQLSLRFVIGKAPLDVVDGITKNLSVVVEVLSSFPCGLRALRALDITISCASRARNQLARLFDDLITLCRGRRIRCIVQKTL